MHFKHSAESLHTEPWSRHSQEAGQPTCPRRILQTLSGAGVENLQEPSQWLTVPHLVLGQEQGVWSRPLGLRRHKKGAHREIFPGLPRRRGAWAARPRPDGVHLQELGGGQGQSFLTRELKQGGAAWKSQASPLVWSLCVKAALRHRGEILSQRT